MSTHPSMQSELQGIATLLGMQDGDTLTPDTAQLFLNGHGQAALARHLAMIRQALPPDAAEAQDLQQLETRLRCLRTLTTAKERLAL